MKSDVFQQLFDHGTSKMGGPSDKVKLRFRMLRRKGADFMLLPLSNPLAVKALTLYAPQNLIARFATDLLRFSLKIGLPVPLKEVELEIRKSSPLIRFFTDALNLTGLGATDFAVIAGNPKDAARRYVFMLFDTLHRPAVVVKVGLGKEGSATVANESRFLEQCASADGMIPEPQGNRRGEDFAAFALSYQPGSAPSIHEEEGVSSCLGQWVQDDEKVKVGELPVWPRLVDACSDVEGFDELAAAVKDARVSPVIYHGDFAPWNIKIRPGDGRWVVLDWERGEPRGLPAWDWFHYVVQTGVLVEQLSEKDLRAKLFHAMDSKRFTDYAARTGIESIKLELALLYLLYSTRVIGQAAGDECVTSLYDHLLKERSTGIDRDRQDFRRFWAARLRGGGSWLKDKLAYLPGAFLAWSGYRNRVPASAFTLLGFVVALLGTFAVFKTVDHEFGRGVGLVIVLLISSSLASAEGMLARVTGTETRLGTGLERLVGLASFACVTGLLAWWARDSQSRWLPDDWRVPVLVLALVAGIALYALRMITELKRQTVPGELAFRGGAFCGIRPILTWMSDGILRVFFLGAAWALGMFWDFLAVYGVLLAVTALADGSRLRSWLRVGDIPDGFVARTLAGLRRTVVRFWRRLLFFRVFLSHKRAQLFGFGSRWVSTGVSQTPVPEKVDVVYLWKDESDADWVAQREEFLERIGPGRGFNRIDMGSRSTKTSLDRLKYSMRSIDKYFKSLGKIFLVTDGQRPAWLRPDDPRVVIVNLKDIFTDRSYLPSYNSQAIESYFYNIPGLSECFVYLNDDFFLNCPVHADDFFGKGGRIKIRLGRAVAARGVPSVHEEGDTSAQKNSNLVLDRHFKNEPRLTVMHRPYAHRKSLMAKAAEEFPEEFHLTRRSHFRSIEMFALHSYLIPYWAYYTGNAEIVPPQLFRKDMFYWSNDRRHNEEVLQRIQKTDQVSFCIQAELSTQLTEASVQSYREAMETVFPDKSSFEI